MKPSFNILLFVLFLGVTLLPSTAAFAQNEQKPIDKSQAVERAQQKVKGRVLKVDQSKSTYRVKVLQKSGRVVSVDVDKNSGKVSKERKKD